MNREPWQAYIDEFRQRADRIPADAFERSTLLFEAAHETYANATNKLTAAGWDEERALMMGRVFGSVVKDWVERDGQNVGALEERLRTEFSDWSG